MIIKYLGTNYQINNILQILFDIYNSLIFTIFYK
jgi:hypothetical protein